MGNTTTTPITTKKYWFCGFCALESSFPNPGGYPSKTSSPYTIGGRPELKFTISTRFDENKKIYVKLQLTPLTESSLDSKQETAMARIKLNVLGEIKTQQKSVPFHFTQDSGIIDWKQEYLCSFSDYRSQSFASSPDAIKKIRIDMIYCDLTWHGSFAHINSLEDPIMYDMRPFFDNSKFSDVTLVMKNECGEDEPLPAHKIVLASHSPVFAAMFETPMREARENKVDIEDIKFDTMSMVLRYLYTGTCGDSNDPKVLWEVFEAAQKYGMEKVKVLCEWKFMKSLTIEHIVDTLGNIDFDLERQYEVMQKYNFNLSGGRPKHSEMFSELMRQIFKKQTYAPDRIDAIKIALIHWYTGEAKEFSTTDVLWKIFALAKEHNLEAGRNFCERELLNQINCGNVVSMIDNAGNYGSKEIYSRALRLAVERRTEISEREDFKQLCRKKPHLGVEFLEFCRFSG